MKLKTMLLLISSAVLMAQTYVIQGPTKPKIYEKTAQKELAEYLKKRIGGNDILLNGKGNVVFHVGDTELAAKHGIVSTKLPDEKWFIKTVGNSIILNGGGTHGALFAVYHFLEDHCDIHWWSENEEHVPKASMLELTDIDRSGKPFFMYRSVHVDVDSRDTSFQYAFIRNRLSSAQSGRRLDTKFGGSFDFGSPRPQHSFLSYVPPKQYFKEHPEYYAMNAEGKRLESLEMQLCLSNRELRGVVLERMLAFIRQDREKCAKENRRPPQVYDFSQEDNKKPCLCPECKAFAEKHSHSGLLLDFLKPVCEGIAKEYPGIYVSTLAYNWTEDLPKEVSAPDNLVVRLCDTKSNSTRSILDPQNSRFHDLVCGWGKIAKHLFIWDYGITYTANTQSFPFASELYFGDLYKLYAQNNVSGVFWEHEWDYCGDMWELKFFMECKLMEDPFADADALMNLFMDKYYGAAGKYILQARRLIDKAARDGNGNIGMYPQISDFDFLSKDTIMECQELFARAQDAVADDETLVLRVHRAQLGLDKLLCYRAGSTPHFGPKRKTSGSVIPTEPSVRRLGTSGIKWLERYKGSLAMRGELDELLSAYGSKIKPPEKLKDKSFYYVPAVAAHNFDPKNLVVVPDEDALGGKAFRILVKGRDLYKLPFGFGYYNNTTKQHILSEKITEAPASKGYNLLYIGRAKIPACKTTVWINSSWTIQYELPKYDLIEQEFDIYITVKFAGPEYYPDQTGENYIFVDAIYFVE